MSHGILRGDGNLMTPEFIQVKDFEAQTASTFANAFARLTQLPQDVIPIQVDSFGGHVYSLLGMIDTIDSSKKPVCTFVTSKAISCGAVLLSGGTPGFRFASKSATILIHQVASTAMGKNSDVQADAIETQRLNDLVMEVLAKNSKKPKRFYSDLLRSSGNADFYMSAKEAKKYGLIDHIGVPTIEMNVMVRYGISL